MCARSIFSAPRRAWPVPAESGAVHVLHHRQGRGREGATLYRHRQSRRDPALRLRRSQQFRGVKGYEDYAGRKAYATAVTSGAPAPKARRKARPKAMTSPTFLSARRSRSSRASSRARKSAPSRKSQWSQFHQPALRGRAQEHRIIRARSAPVVHQMATPLHPAALPEPQTVEA